MRGARRLLRLLFPTVAERLGYPADAKLLIIHADDLAVAHSENVATFESLDKHTVSSASVMVPCPRLAEVAAYSKLHPDADIGVHVTLTSEWKFYRWTSVAPADQVPSLLDPTGHFWPTTEEAVKHAQTDEVEREMRAQLERALAVGIHPTHLDSHMRCAFATPGMFVAYVKVAREFHLPFLVSAEESARLLSLLSPHDVVVDSVLLANHGVPPQQWLSFYVNQIKNLKPGLTCMIVHMGYDDLELRAITVDHEIYGAAWRQRDFDVVNSPEFQQALHDNHIIVIRWKDLQTLVN